MVVEREAGGGTGSARRRRERRLRSMLRHERMSVEMALAESTHHSAPRGKKMARAGGERETNDTATLRKMLLPRVGFCGTLWDICPCLLLMSLCRRWWTSCRTLSISSPHSRLILSRLSKCPRSCTSMSLCARPCALRSWWNSWWKYRRPCLSLRCSGLWNSSSTFQFLVVEDQVLVFMVFSQDSVQQRRLPENAFLSGLWSRSFTLFLVEVFLVLSQVRVHLLLTLQLVLKNAQMSLVKGFFALFSKLKKVRRSLRTRGRNSLRTPAHGRQRLSWRTPSSGCGSRMTTLASRTTGTDALGRLPGSHRLASGLCGSAQGMRREGLLLAQGYACLYVYPPSSSSSSAWQPPPGVRVGGILLAQGYACLYVYPPSSSSWVRSSTASPGRYINTGQG